MWLKFFETIRAVATVEGVHKIKNIDFDLWFPGFCLDLNVKLYKI